MAAVSWLGITTNRLSAFRSVPSFFFFFSHETHLNLLTAEFSFQNPVRSENQATTSIYVGRRANAPTVNFAKKMKQKKGGVDFYSIEN